jgi:hypothetical protein
MFLLYKCIYFSNNTFIASSVSQDPDGRACYWLESGVLWSFGGKLSMLNVRVAVQGCVGVLPVPINLGGDDGQKAKQFVILV